MNLSVHPSPADPEPEPLSPPVKRSHHPVWRAVGWITTGLVGLVLLFVITVAVLSHSARFHAYLLGVVNKDVSTGLGAQVQLQNFTLHLSNLSLDLYGLTVHGANPYPDPPILQVQHVIVGVRVVSILHRKWYLDNLAIDQPVVRVFTDANGVSNIPHPRSSGNSSHTSLFDLAIRHAVLNHGQIFYNDRRSLMGADLHQVELRAAFDTALNQYAGHLSYADGHLNSGTYYAIPHSLDANFDVTPTTFHLTNTTLHLGASELTVNAAVQNFSQPTVQAQYAAVLQGGNLRQLLHDPSIPAGVIRINGSAKYQDEPGHPLLQTLAVTGDLSSPQLVVDTPSLRAVISDLGSHYTLANGNANVADLHARLLGGALSASATITGLGSDMHSEVKASLRDISLAGLQAASGERMPGTVSLGGTLNAEATATWGKTLSDLLLRANAGIQGTLSGRTAENAGTVIPVSSQIHATYSGVNKNIALANSFVRMPANTLNLNGSSGTRAEIHIAFQSTNLAELETVADLFRTPIDGTHVQPLGLAGTAAFDGDLRGTTSDPHLSGQLIANNLQFHGQTLRRVRTGVDVSPSYVKLQNAQLQLEPQGQVNLNASAGLDHWSLVPTSPLQVQMSATQLQLANLEKLAGSSVPATGTLDANLTLHGTELNPVGQGSLSITHAEVYNQPIRTVNLTFSDTGNDVHGNLSAALPAGSLWSTFSVQPQQKTYTVELNATGVQLGQLEAVSSRSLDVQGVLRLHATGRGSFSNPELVATVDIPQLTLEHQILKAINLNLNVANHVATAALSTAALDTTLSGKARIELTGQEMTDATFDSTSIPLQPLLAAYAPAAAADVSGQTEIHATLHGPLKNTKLIQAKITMPTLQLAYGKTVQLAAASPIQVDYNAGLITLKPTTLRGTDTNLQLGGSYSPGNKESLSLMLVGAVDLHLAQMFDPEIQSSGQLQFDVHANGTGGGPDLGGQIRIVDAGYVSGSLPLGLQHGNGVLTLSNGRINVSSFQGTVGGGNVTANGGVQYSPSLQFGLGVSASGVRMLYPQGVRETLNANLRLAGNATNALLAGTVDIPSLSFTPAFDLTSFTNQFSGGIAAPPTPGFSQNLALRIAIHSSNDLNLASRTLSIDGSANLQVVGSAAQPVILGRVNLTRGDIIFNGDRFLLRGGTIQFVNPAETEPVVNLTLNTTIQQYSIYMRFNGPISQMRTNYSSEPALPAADIINLVAFGHTTEATANAAATPANQEAESLIASQVSSQVTSRFAKVAGISQLSIDPILAGGSSAGPLGANITIQQHVTGNLFVTFSTNVQSTQNQTIMVQYRVSPKFSVSATRDETGGFAVDTTIKRSW